MLLIQQNETDGEYRRVPLHLVDSTDGLTAEEGISVASAEICKLAAGTPAFAATSANIVEVSDGLYYVELTAAEVDTLGVLIVRFKDGDTAEFQVLCQVVPWDPYDATRMGMTALPNVDAGLTGGVPTSYNDSGWVTLGAWQGAAPFPLVAGYVLADAHAINASSSAADRAEEFFGALTALEAANAGANFESYFDGSGDYVPPAGSLAVDVASISGSTAAADNLEASFASNALTVDANGRVDVGSWLGTAVTTSAGTSKPEVDAYSISDAASAADNVQANITNLNATISSRATPAQILSDTNNLLVVDANGRVDVGSWVGNTVSFTGSIGPNVNVDGIDGDTATATDLTNVDWSHIDEDISTRAAPSDILQTPANKINNLANGRVDVGAWLGAVVVLSSGNKPEVNVFSISESTVAADAIEANIGNLDVALSDIAGAGFSTATHSLEVVGDNDNDIRISSSVDDPGAAATTTTFTGANSLSATDNFYRGSVVVFTSGTLQGIARRCNAYTGASQTFDFSPYPLPAIPQDGDTFDIMGRIDP